jgi:hypothetical protein
MSRLSPFAAVVKVLGAVACIVLLAYLAGRGGEVPDSPAPAPPQSGRIDRKITGPPGNQISTSFVSLRRTLLFLETS